MFFHQRNKLTFGSTSVDPAILAEKLQTIAFTACGCFEGDISEQNKEEKNPIIWRLSDYIDNSGTIPFSTESKIMKAFKSLQRK